MPNKLTIFMGHDPRETVAYDVARSSILRNAARPKSIQVRPLELPQLGKILTRPVEKKDGKLWCPISQAHMATEFAISRFCVPFLQKKGWALFCDCDVLALADIAELFALADKKYAVMVVKHQQANTGDTKMDGQVQTYYERKNWSSVVLWNCEHPAHQALGLKELNTLPGRDLHAFSWLESDLIGALPVAWNYLVGVGAPDYLPKLAHFTLGGPWIPNWKVLDTKLEALWSAEAARLGHSEKIEL